MVLYSLFLHHNDIWDKSCLTFLYILKLYLYSSLTEGACLKVMLQSGKYDLVHEFFEKMKRSGVALKALTYKGTIIHAYLFHIFLYNVLLLCYLLLFSSGESFLGRRQSQ